MFTVGMYAEAYTDKQEAVTVVAENSKIAKKNLLFVSAILQDYFIRWLPYRQQRAQELP